MKLLKGKHLRPDAGSIDQPSLCGGALFAVWVSNSFGGGIKAWGMWLSSGSVIALGGMLPTETEDRASCMVAGIMVLSDPS